MGRGAGPHLAAQLRRRSAWRREPERHGRPRASLLLPEHPPRRPARQTRARRRPRQFASRAGYGARQDDAQDDPVDGARNRGAARLPAQGRFDSRLESRAVQLNGGRRPKIEIIPGLVHYPAYLGRAAQEKLRDALRDVVRAAPLFQPYMPRTAKPFSVKMTNCGKLGWVADERGYRYQETHPVTGAPWPPIPTLRSPPGLNSRPRRRRPRLASSISMTRPPAWVCIRTATKRTFPYPSCRCRLAMRAFFAWVARNGATQRAP